MRSPSRPAPFARLISSATIFQWRAGANARSGSLQDLLNCRSHTVDRLPHFDRVDRRCHWPHYAADFTEAEGDCRRRFEFAGHRPRPDGAGSSGYSLWRPGLDGSGLPADPQRQSVRARVSLYGSNGALLAQSAEATVAPGEFHSFDFDRAEIPASGEPIGGRLPMRVSLAATAIDPSSLIQDPEATGPLAASFELIDNSAGRTAAVWVTVGFFEVAPAPKPQ